jgi:hypothetical protein
MKRGGILCARVRPGERRRVRPLPRAPFERREGPSTYPTDLANGSTLRAPIPVGARRVRLISLKQSITPPAWVVLTMVHTISLGAALLIILVAIVFLFLVGPFGLLILILAAILLWYAFGPGARRVVISG